MKYFNYIMLLGVLCLTSCKYEIDYNADLPEDKLVVAAFVEEDSTITMELFHSSKPGVFEGYSVEDDWKKKSEKNDVDPDYYDFRRLRAMVKDAKLTVQVNESNEFTAASDKNIPNKYTFPYTPQHNDRLLFTLAAEGYPQVNYPLTVNLSAPKIDSFAYYTRQKASDGYYSTRNQIVVYFEINDDGGENYYRFCPGIFNGNNSRMEFVYPEILYESHSGVYLGNNTYMFDDEDNESGVNEYGVFSNQKFKGEKYILKMAFNIWSYDLENMHDDFVISKIDKNSYDYLYSLGTYLNSFTLNMNPVLIPDPLGNAYGFIGVKKSWKRVVNSK